MNRWDHSETVFRDSQDDDLLLTTLTEACAKTDWQVHSFCLMSNHFHLVVETPRANLVPSHLKMGAAGSLANCLRNHPE